MKKSHEKAEPKKAEPKRVPTAAELLQALTDDDGEAKRRQVYLDPDLYRKANFIASALDVSLPDYVNARLRPIILAELEDAKRLVIRD